MSRYLCRNVCSAGAVSRNECAGCNSPLDIGDTWTLALDQKWHQACFACDKCKIPINKRNSFFCGKGLRLCVDCAKMSDPRAREKKMCHGCSKGVATVFIEAMEKAWHTDCFRCHECNRLLNANVKYLTKSVNEKLRKGGESVKKVPRCEECATESTGSLVVQDYII